MKCYFRNFNRFVDFLFVTIFFFVRRDILPFFLLLVNLLKYYLLKRILASSRCFITSLPSLFIGYIFLIVSILSQRTITFTIVNFFQSIKISVFIVFYAIRMISMSFVMFETVSMLSLALARSKSSWYSMDTIGIVDQSWVFLLYFSLFSRCFPY